METHSIDDSSQRSRSRRLHYSLPLLCVCVCVCVCRLFEVNKQLKAVSTLEGGKQLFHHYAHVYNRGVHLYWNNHVPTIQTCTETIKCKHTPHKHQDHQQLFVVSPSSSRMQVFLKNHTHFFSFTNNIRLPLAISLS